MSVHRSPFPTCLTKLLPSLSEALTLLQEVLNIEQMMLLENYTEFFSKVKQKPKDSVEDAKKWLLGDLVTKDFQVCLS